jgi:uncharacterized lipoprotein YmbA
MNNQEINSQSSEEKKEHMMLIEIPNIEMLQEVLDKGIESNSPMIFQDKKGNVWQINLHNELQQEISNYMADENAKETGNEPKENGNQPEVENSPKEHKDVGKEEKPISEVFD